MCHGSQAVLRVCTHTHTISYTSIFVSRSSSLMLKAMSSHQSPLESTSNSNLISHKIFLAFFLSIFMNPFSKNKIVPIIRTPLCLTNLLIQLDCDATGCWLPPAPAWLSATFQLVPSSSTGSDPPTAPACQPSSCWNHNPFSDLSSFCHLPCLGLSSGFLIALERKGDNTCFKRKE